MTDKIVDSRTTMEREELEKLIKKYYGQDINIILDIRLDYFESFPQLIPLIIVDKYNRVLDIYYGYYYSEYYYNIDNYFKDKKEKQEEYLKRNGIIEVHND
jgi:hypothetical protein